MANDNVFHLRLDSDLRSEIDEQSASLGITSSEWVRDAIEAYMNMDKKDTISSEEIVDMDWDELCEVIDDLELNINPDEFDNSNIFASPDENDTEELRNEVLNVLGFTEAEDQENTD